MAWSSAAVSSDKVDALAADKPLFISGNVFSANKDNMRWTSWDGTTWPTGDTDTFPGFPAYYGADGLAHAATKSTITAGERYHSWWDAISMTGSFDSLFLLCDAGTADGGATINIAVTIADDNAFTTNVINFYSANVNSTAGVQRICHLPATGYTGSGFIRVTFSINTAGQDYDAQSRPLLYECVLGTRYQMSKKGIRPWDPEPMTNNVVRHISDSGVISSYAKMAGGWNSSMEWHLDMAGGLYNLDDVDTLRNFWNDTNYGTESFVYVEDPSTSPEFARLVKTSAQVLSMPYSGPNERSFGMEMQELPLFATWSP